MSPRDPIREIRRRRVYAAATPYRDRRLRGKASRRRRDWRGDGHVTRVDSARRPQAGRVTPQRDGLTRAARKRERLFLPARGRRPKPAAPARSRRWRSRNDSFDSNRLPSRKSRLSAWGSPVPNWDRSLVDLPQAATSRPWTGSVHQTRSRAIKGRRSMDIDWRSAVP